MDDTNQRTKKILFILFFAFVCFFCISILLWYFFLKEEPTTKTPGAGIPFSSNIARGFNFIFSTNQNQESTSETVVSEGENSPLVEIWKKPTTGHTFAINYLIQEVYSTTTPKKTKANPNPVPVLVRSLSKATTSTIMFVDRTTGYIYRYNKETKKTYQITNSQIAGVYDAYIFKNGEKIIMRYLDENESITSVLADIPDVKEGNTPLPLINPTYLQKNVISVSVSKTSQHASYIVKNQTGVSIYTIKDENPELIATNPFSEWSLLYGGDQLYAHTKPSAYIEGSVVALPSFSREETSKTGLLSVISPNGTLFNSMWSSSGLLTYILNKGSTVVTENKTLATKCTWLNLSFVLVCGVPKFLPEESTGLPDDWFQGKYLFEDALYFIDGKTGQHYNLYTFDEKIPTDVTKLETSPDDKDILFIRKQNGSLWLLKTDLLIPSGE